MILTIIFIIISYFFLQLLLFPKLLPKLIEILPLEKDLKFEKLEINFTEKGLDLFISFSILYSALIIPLEASIGKLAVYDSYTGDLITNVHLSEPIVLDPFKDLKVSQLIKLEFESTVPLKRLIKCLSIGGEKEFLRTSLRLEFMLDLNIGGLMKIKTMKCSKIAHLGKSEEDKAKFRKRKLWEKQIWIKMIYFVQKEYLQLIGYTFNPAEYQILIDNPYCITEPIDNVDSPLIPTISISPHYLIQDLIPNPEISLNISPGLFTTSQTTITFSYPPAINISIGVVELDLYLNQALVCHVICDPFAISPKSNSAIYTVTVLPRVVTNPITGSISGGLSIIRGILTGVGNGILFQEWGQGSTIVGVRNIQFKDCNGQVGWIDEVLDGFEIEQNLDLGRGVEMVGEKRDEIADLVKNIWMAILKKIK